MRKLTEKWKKLSKKKRTVLVSALGGLGVLVLLVVGISSILSKAQPKEGMSKYSLYIIQKEEPLIFKGKSSATKEESYYEDATLGKLDQVLVQNGQEVEVGQDILVYLDEAEKEKSSKQEKEIARLEQEAQYRSEDVGRVQGKINTANAKLQTEQANVNTLTERKNATTNEAEKAQLAGEIEGAQAKVEQYKQEIEALNDELITLNRAVSSAQSEVDSAKGELSDASNKITHTIKAKTAGIVYLNKAVEKTASTPILQIVSSDTKVIGEISEYDYNQVHENEEVLLRSTGTKESIKGKITYVSKIPKVSGAGENLVSTYTFDISPESFIHYGFNVEVLVPQNAMMIPSTAVLTEKGAIYAFVYKNGKIEKRQIEVEEHNRELYIKKGLSEQEEVLNPVDETLKDGQEVNL